MMPPFSTKSDSSKLSVKFDLMAISQRWKSRGSPTGTSGIADRSWMSVIPGSFTLARLFAAIAFLIIICAPGYLEPDFYWHLKTGELIAQSGSVPVTDPFSYTFSGKPWVAHEWLSELILYWVVQAGGLDALRLLPALAAAIVFLLMHAIAKRLIGKDAVAALVTAFFFAPVLSYFCLRPQIYTYLFFTTYLLVLVDFKYFRSARLLWLLPVLMLAWVNLHGAFMSGIGLLVAFIATETSNGWLFPVRHARNARKLGMLVLATAATLMVTVANPQGLRILLYPFELVSMEASRTMIAEWHSPDFHRLLPQLSLAGIFAFFVAAIYARRKPDVTELLIPLLLTYAGLSAWRHLPLMSIVLMGFFCVMLRQIQPSQIIASAFNAGRPMRAAGEQQVTPAQAGLIHLLVLLAAIAAAGAGFIKIEQPEEPSRFVPTGAVEYVQKNQLSGRILNDYDLGGYLIYRLWPTHKVFIDGRADLYGDDFLKAYFKVDKADEGWEKAIDDHAIDIVVFARNAPLRQVLLASGKFREAYSDAHHAVLLRDLPRFKQQLDHPVHR